MSKWFLGILALVLVVGLVGCPATAPAGNDVNSGGTTGDSSAVKTGTVTIDGDLNQLILGKSLSLSDWRGIITAQVPKVKRIEMYFIDPEANLSITWAEAEVVDGNFRVSCEVPEGRYLMAVGFFKADHLGGNQLFWANANIIVESGKNTDVDIVAQIQSVIHVKFNLSDFPDSVATATQFTIFRWLPTGNGETYQGNLTTVDGVTTADIWLPWDFSGGAMSIDEVSVSSKVTFNWEQMVLEEAWSIPYTPSGTVNITNVNFWWPGRVLANGLDYESIQDAINSNVGGIADIKLGPGTYKVSTIMIPPRTSARISGVLGLTEIYSSELTAIKAYSDDEGHSINLENLKIRAAIKGDQDFYASESNSVIFVQGKELWMKNCIVHAAWSAAVCVDDSNQVEIDHCVVVGSGARNALSVYNGKPKTCLVKNSILMNCYNALQEEHAVEGVTRAIVCVNCNFNGGRIFGNPIWQYTVSMSPLRWEDPMFIIDPMVNPSQSDCRLADDSPLLGLADDGGNIGLEQ